MHQKLIQKGMHQSVADVITETFARTKPKGLHIVSQLPCPGPGVSYYCFDFIGIVEESLEYAADLLLRNIVEPARSILAAIRAPEGIPDVYGMGIHDEGCLCGLSADSGSFAHEPVMGGMEGMTI